MRELTYSQALREALTEEMERNPRHPPARRGHRRLRRRVQGHRGTAGPLRAGAGDRDAHLRGWLHRRGRRAGHDRQASHGRIDVHGLRLRRRRLDLQPGGQDAVHVGRTGAGAVGDPHAAGRRPRQRRPALAEPGDLLHAHPRPEGCAARDTLRRQGPAQDGPARSQPGDLHRAQAALQHQGPGAGRRVHDPAGQGRHQARRRST